MSESPASQHQTVLVIDYGTQHAQLLARRVREAHVYSEVVPQTWSVQKVVDRAPAAIIISGGPQSALEPGVKAVDPKLFETGIPILGVGYGFQAMVQALGGTTEQTGQTYQDRVATLVSAAGKDSLLLQDVPADIKVHMNHTNSVTHAPAGFTVLAGTEDHTITAIADESRNLFGVQWHPENKSSDYGQAVIENFLFKAADLTADWTTTEFIAEQIHLIKEQVGASHVICGLSGGVDSAVAAALVQRAIGDQLTCVFVDHGLMRKNEAEQVEKDFVASTGVRLIMAKEQERFLAALAGVTDPETKRKTIGREFIRSFEAAEQQVLKEVAQEGATVEFLVQGTLYPDVVESGDGEGAVNIKSHHNVGGLPEDMEFKLIEPLRALFKDEVRAVGRELGLPEVIVGRHPFPGPGLGIRIIGEVTKERLDLLREADAIAREELEASGLNEEVWQLPVVLLADVRSVGVQHEARTYGHPIVLRPVSSEDAMTADWSRLPYDLLAKISNRITAEVDGVNRVVLDVTSKPPGTIEWE